MEYPKNNPIDHARTTRQHAGESLKDGTNAPGLGAVAVGVVALVAGLFALATGHVAVGLAAVILAAVAGAAGLTWLARAHRRVRDAELQWAAKYSEEPAPPPTS
ncbi:hypothetical protein [Mycobacterium sp.]|uniref:hypothetical protein n=1 Tax=Mycobacterium sp. TaxID=1785 RepID=UPI003F97CE27